MCQLVGGLLVLLAVLWLIVRSLSRESRKSGAYLSNLQCPSCGRRMPAHGLACPICSPDFDQAAVSEQADLDATARQLAAFLAEGSLDRATGERVQQCIDERRRQLADPAAQPLWRTLNRLPVSWPHLGKVPLAERRRALAVFAELPEADRDRLSAPALLMLARLLHWSDSIREALGVYRRLVLGRPEAVKTAETALEAGCLAAQYHEDAEARWFLERALAGTLPAPDRVAAENLLHKVTLPEEELLEVLPVPEPSAPLSEPTPAAVLKPPEPRRTFGEMMAAFMEERNILWGELVGGLLMVGCSVALVISLWATLQSIPFFPFVIFSTLTAGIYGAGFYTLNHWKLESTSRGLLIIATLLVPLDFLVMAGLVLERADPGPLDIYYRLAAEAAALGIFVFLGSRAGRVLTPAGPWLLPVAVLGASACLLLVPRVLGLEPPELVPFLVLASLPVAFHAAGTGLFLRWATRDSTFTESQANAALIFLGLASFTVAVVFGFLIFRSLELGVGLHRLAAPLAAAAVPVLLGGFAVHRALWGQVCNLPTLGQVANLLPREENALGLQRTLGTAVGMAGAAVLLAALALAWPQPAALIAVGAFNFAGLTVAALRYRLPILHAAALPCLAIAFLIGFHLYAGHLAVADEDLATRLGQLALVGLTGVVLLPVVLLSAAAAELCARATRRADAIAYAAGGGVLALASLILVSSDWYDQPEPAAWVYGVYGALVLTMNLRWHRTDLGWAGSGLLHLAVLFGVTAWLKEQPWFAGFREGLLDPRCVQALGVGLAGLGLLDILGRRALRRTGERAWLDAGWAAGDRVVLTLVLAAQLFVAVLGIVPELIAELTPDGRTFRLDGWPAEHGHAYGPGGWLFLGALAALLILTLWERFRDAITGLVILAVCTLILAAGLVREELASASALRWGFGLGLLASSVVVWSREPLGKVATRLGIVIPEGTPVSTFARRFLIGGMLGPLLALTGAVALVVVISGTRPTGPLSSSFFRQVGWIGSNLVPLILAIVALVGHAVRERAAAHAFAAGLIATVTVPGGQLLRLIIAHEAITDARVVELMQLGTVTTALWALGWLMSRRWVHSWRGRVETPLPGRLMSAQLGLAVTGNVVVLGVALLLLINRFPLHAPWTLAAGTPLGWLTWLLTTLATLRLAWERAWPRGLILGVSGVLAVGLLACTVAVQWPAYSFRTLMLGTAGSGLAIAYLAWVTAVRHGPEARATSGLLWGVPAAGVGCLIGAVVFLGVQTAVVHQDHLWAAAAIGLASVAAALIGVRHREEASAFAAGLGFELAAGFVVWHSHVNLPVAQWWVVLAQGVLLAGAVWAVTWLTLRRRFYESSVLTLGSTPFLAVQAFLLMLGQCNVLMVPLVQLLADPAGQPTRAMVQAGQFAGWVGWLLTAFAALGYSWRVLPGGAVHIMAVAGLLAGILAASRASAAGGCWLGYHVLTASWSLLGLVILVAGWVGSEARVLGPAFWTLKRRVRTVRRLATLFPAASARRWVAFVCLFVVALALGGTIADPTRPLGGAAATLAVGVLLGALAVWTRRPPSVYASGLLACVIGLLLWRAWLAKEFAVWRELPWAPDILDTFVFTQVLCLAGASAAWSLVDAALRARVPPVVVRGRFVPFSHLAAWVALNLLAALVLGGLASDLSFLSMHVAGRFAWGALAAVAVAFVLCLWDSEATFSPGALYTTGLLAIGLALHSRVEALPIAQRPVELGWTTALVLATFVLLTNVVARFTPRLKPAHYLPVHPSTRPESWPMTWFLLTQGISAGLAVALAVWISFHFGTFGERLAGPLAVLILIPEGVFLARWERRFLPEEPAASWQRHLPHAATLFLGAVLLTTLGWALLGPLDVAAWLHRSVLLLLALVAMAGIAGVLLPRLLSSASPWVESGRRMAGVLGGLAALVLLAVLTQEALLYDADLRRAPVFVWAVVLVALMLAAMAAGGIGLALRPAADPLGLSERGRMAYVYAAELVLVLLGAHLRLNIPDLDHVLCQYWPFLTMATAYVGIGLSELFRRRGLRVLAEPLQWTGVFLPLLPLLAFWVRPPETLRNWAVDSVRGLEPFLRYLDALPTGWGSHAGLWWVLAVLYATLAASQKSFRFALVAALAANFGLWALWAQFEVHFFEHPQVWLIPLALIVLAAEHVNRDRLLPAQSAGLRYFALGVLYVSSTADMYLTGLGESVLLPVVLAVLAVLGVLAGILLRVQAFLFLGVGFLFLDVFSQIWHAAVGRQQTWVWYASGIVLGAAILALFAVFEKRRQDVVRVVEEIRRWD